jgi:hypothetical protein
MNEFFLLMCERINELLHGRNLPLCSQDISSRMESGDIDNICWS